MAVDGVLYDDSTDVVMVVHSNVGVDVESSGGGGAFAKW